ncbi:hypothetical protein AAG906_020890 [Vitis piasezkii]
MPQAASTDPPATPPVPPAAPPPSQDFITLSGSEFRGMVLLFKTLNATHDTLFRKIRDIQAQQDQHTIILDQHIAILSRSEYPGLAPPRSTFPGHQSQELRMRRLFHREDYHDDVPPVPLTRQP